MQGLHKRVLLALAMAWSASAAGAQFAMPIPPETERALLGARDLIFPYMEPVLPARYLRGGEYHVPGAKYVKLHFSEFVLPAGITVEVSNPDRSEVWRYSATERDAFTVDAEYGDDGIRSFSAMSISGDTALVRYMGYTDLFDPAEHSVRFDARMPNRETADPVLREDAKKGNSVIENSCGDSERLDAICWADDHPAKYERSSPVALVVTSSGKQCTAWRVGGGNHLFTARHCIGSQSALDGAEIWFNYEAAVCGGEESAEVVKVTGRELLASNYHLDYTLFSVNDFSRISEFGNLGLDVRDGTVGEPIFIPQHGNGNAKQIAIESDMNNSGRCEIDDNAVNGFIEGSDIGYFCDTATSSSGSPVISAVTGRAIALHHYGGCLNSGTKVARIWPQVKEFFGGRVPRGNADGDWAPANELPVAQFNETCDGLSCRFDSLDSEDPDGELVEYHWDFDDNHATATGQDVSYDFTAAGKYAVALTVIDDEGASDSVLRTISVSAPNDNPQARFAFQCVETACTFNAASSSDSDGSVVSWSWALGDGATATGETVEHHYAEGGDYTIGLTVEDDDGATDFTSRAVSVVSANQPPSAHFELECDFLVCSVDASGSSDSDGEIASYQWRFGDGTVATGNHVRHEFKQPGAYTITLEVTDDDGASDAFGQSANVEEEETNRSPVAGFSVSCDNNVCTFDAGRSSDSDGYLVTFRWTFPDGSTRRGRITHHTFESEGPHTVRLTVQDNKGGEASTEHDLSVTIPSDPVARFSVDCDELSCTLDAGSSTASEGSITKYDWSFGDGTTATGSYVSHEYTRDGDYTVTLKVTDSSKSSISSSRTIRVETAEQIRLTARLGTETKSLAAALEWSGAREGRVEVYRNAEHLATVVDAQAFTDRALRPLRGTVTYRVCESESGRCSNFSKLRLGK